MAWGQSPEHQTQRFHNVSSLAFVTGRRCVLTRILLNASPRLLKPHIHHTVHTTVVMVYWSLFQFGRHSTLV